MSNEKKYDPFLGFNQLSEMWDKQITGLLYNFADNKEFVRTASIGINSYSMYLEKLKKSQELFASLMNIPTKKDVANAAKLSIQTEEKIDILEEQIWKLQDSVNSITKENVGMFEETLSIVIQMKYEFQKIAKEVAETKKVQADLLELRKEIERDLIGSVREKPKKESEKKQDKELVLSGSNK
ncbi:polyhydroxyalkanoate biosynthesis repressor PhaR [Neobacillus sp. YX16]|uniref:polyhydroxyalkanoate biosynthesis repressor PhaR n=1 Tax=Neobacillus sp. YX16 TaxID=3047874 RepID=UPI0024C39C67|nr:polyhydroxyalkanoate biosynthesis repressor PhaR [Neobacillus sp. YX16]WHZ05011.1 polyhydroxyalkanoate biosynthesis repressor PhaR [Neobacillus sp. YX16]